MTDAQIARIESSISENDWYTVAYIVADAMNLDALDDQIASLEARHDAAGYLTQEISMERAALADRLNAALIHNGYLHYL